MAPVKKRRHHLGSGLPVDFTVHRGHYILVDWETSGGKLKGTVAASFYGTRSECDRTAGFFGENTLSKTR